MRFSAISGSWETVHQQGCRCRPGSRVLRHVWHREPCASQYTLHIQASTKNSSVLALESRHPGSAEPSIQTHCRLFSASQNLLSCPSRNVSKTTKACGLSVCPSGTIFLPHFFHFLCKKAAVTARRILAGGLPVFFCEAIPLPSLYTTSPKSVKSAMSMLTYKYCTRVSSFSMSLDLLVVLVLRLQVSPFSPSPLSCSTDSLPLAIVIALVSESILICSALILYTNIGCITWKSC